MPIYTDLFKYNDAIYGKHWSDKLHILPSYMPSWVYTYFDEFKHFNKAHDSYFKYDKYVVIVNISFEAKYNIPKNIDLYDSYLRTGNVVVIGKEPEV